MARWRDAFPGLRAFQEGRSRTVFSVRLERFGQRFVRSRNPVDGCGDAGFAENRLSAFEAAEQKGFQECRDLRFLDTGLVQRPFDGIEHLRLLVEVEVA